MSNLRKRKVYTSRYKNPRIISSRGKSERRKESPRILKRIIRFAILILIVFGINYLFTNDYLRIKNIRIVGDNTFQSQIIEVAQKELDKSRLLIFKNNNFLLMNKNSIEEEIKSQIPEVKEIIITKKFSDSIELKITERQASIGWQVRDKRYLLDGDGYLLKETDTFDGYVAVKDNSEIEVSKDKRIVYPNFIHFVKDMSDKFTSLKIGVKSIEISETTFIIDVFTQDGYKIVLNTTKSLSEQISKLEEALKYIGDSISKLDYIDLTVKNKAVYKYK
jgi:cell division septal protein FtsQ